MPAPGIAPPALAQAILEALAVPLVVVDEGLTVVWMSPGFATLAGADLEAQRGRALQDMGGPWDSDPLATRLRQVAAGGAPFEGLEVPAGDPGDGDRSVLQVSARPLDATSGATTPPVLIAVEDVTDRHRLEGEARAYARELERSNRELQDFAHAASHDLQEPLRKIRTYADRLPALIGEADLNERAARYLVRLGEATERMQERTEALLQLARLGRKRPELERVDLNEVLEQVLLDLDVAVRETRADIQVEDLPTLEADPTQMRVLFQNLVSNALKFSPAGERPVVRVRTENGGEASVGDRTIVVEDEGIGFEQEYAERIFTAFQRLHGRTEYGGSGVGLSLCRRVVEHHHGTIRAEGEAGGGARFLITLPMKHDEEPRP